MKQIVLLALVVAVAACADGNTPDGGLPDGGLSDGGVLEKYKVTGTVGGLGQADATLKFQGVGADRTATSDSTGAYQFLEVVPGNYTLVASKKGFAYTPSSQVVKVISADVKVPLISSVAAQNTFAVSGTVSGDATDGVGLTLTKSGSTVASTLSTAGGVFRLDGVEAGPYTLAPSLLGYEFTPATRSVSMTVADVTGLNFTSRVVPQTVGGTVSGDVQDGVVLKLVSSTGKSLQTTTNASGVFSVSGVVPGTYTLTPSHTGYAFSLSHSW